MRMEWLTYAHMLTGFQHQGIMVCTEEREGFMNAERVKNVAEVVSLPLAYFEINFLARSTSSGML